jgi:hypothetical protein
MVSNWFSAIRRRKMRELERDDALRRQQELHAGDEVVEVGHLCQDVVADDEIGALALGDEALGQCGAEELRRAREHCGGARLRPRWRPARCRAPGTPKGRKCCSK